MEWCLNDGVMAEWQVSSNAKIFPPQKNLSFLLIRSFHHHSRMSKWCGNGILWRSDIIHVSFQSFLLQSGIQERWWNDRMRRNEARFLKQGKTLKKEITVIPQSFRHSNTVFYTSHIHSSHLMSFWIWMRSEWFNPGLSPIRRQARIKPFRSHFAII